MNLSKRKEMQSVTFFQNDDIIGEGNGWGEKFSMNRFKKVYTGSVWGFTEVLQIHNSYLK